MSFLETITFFGNDVLVPIKDIELIWRNIGDGGEEIHIKGKGDLSWVECFGKDGDKALARYNMIKYLLRVPSEKAVLKYMKKTTLYNIC